MEKLKALVFKYREIIAYMLFGGVTTAVNIATYAALAAMGFSTAVANAAAWLLAVLTAYFTNRRWVFHSQNTGAAAVKEFLYFVGCRAGTGVMDEAIMVLGVDVLGPRLVAPAHLRLWGLAVKLFSNALVILLNYVFSKLLIFRKRK